MLVPILLFSVELVLAIGIITFNRNFASEVIIASLSDSQNLYIFLLHHVGLSDDGCLMKKMEPAATLSKAAAGMVRAKPKNLGQKNACVMDDML